MTTSTIISVPFHTKKIIGAAGDRTRNHLMLSRTLCQLSYNPFLLIRHPQVLYKDTFGGAILEVMKKLVIVRFFRTLRHTALSEISDFRKLFIYNWMCHMISVGLKLEIGPAAGKGHYR